jgi:hypothetical protein
MKKGLVRLSIGTAFLTLLICATATAQDFQKSYALRAGARVNITNVSGDVIVNGYDGDTIKVTGIKEGRDRDQVEVDDRSDANQIDLRVRYSRNCNCDASIKFEVQVPKSIKFDFDKVSSASGNIEINSVTGRIHASSASGDVKLKEVNGEINAKSASGEVIVKEAVGTVTAESASGDVEVEITQLVGTESMKFSSASGDVSVKLPSSLDAFVDMSTVSGDVKTDFPLEVNERDHGAGRWARGQVGGGSGSRTLRISSASGNVSLKTL